MQTVSQYHDLLTCGTVQFGALWPKDNDETCCLYYLLEGAFTRKIAAYISTRFHISGELNF